MRILKIMTLLMFAAALLLPVTFTSATQDQPATEAPTGFDNKTNGLVSQGQFDADKEVFDEPKLVSDGLGPVYSFNTCKGCHLIETSSPFAELRAGHFDGINFFEHPGGSLIQSSAIDPAAQ